MLDYRYKTILSVALPLMASTFIQSVVLITDSAFLARWDTLAFDASGNAGLIYITLYMCLVGFSDGSQILQSQKIGAKQDGGVKSILLHTYIINGIIGLLLVFFAFHFISDFVMNNSSNAKLAEMQSKFLELRIWGLPFAAITVSTAAYFNAKGETWKVLVCAAVTAISNVIMDYYFIFGTRFFPPMGLEGAAIASSLADGLGCVVSLIILFWSAKKDVFLKVNKFKVQLSEILLISKISSPLVLQGIVALSSWTVFFTWIEQKSTFDLTISQNIRSIYFIAFVPIAGFSATTRIYVSQYVGAKKFEVIPIIQRRIVFLILASLFIILHGNLFYPEKIIEFINPAEMYNNTSASILQLIFGSFILYAIGSVFFQTINGFGKTKISFAIEMASVTAYLSFAYLFIKIFEWDVWKIWLIEYVYFGIFAIAAFAYYFFQIKNTKSL